MENDLKDKSKQLKALKEDYEFNYKLVENSEKSLSTIEGKEFNER